jgi:hypothetical protein
MQSKCKGGNAPARISQNRSFVENRRRLPARRDAQQAIDAPVRYPDDHPDTDVACRRTQHGNVIGIARCSQELIRRSPCIQQRFGRLRARGAGKESESFAAPRACVRQVNASTRQSAQEKRRIFARLRYQLSSSRVAR